MFACHSCSVCIAYVNALMTYPVCANRGEQKYANTDVDRQVGKPIKRSELVFLGPTPSTEYLNVYK